MFPTSFSSNTKSSFKLLILYPIGHFIAKSTNSLSKNKGDPIAVGMINDIAAEPEVGVIYTGTVVKTVDFGAFVNFMGARDGLVHISELRPERVEKTTDIVNVGDKVKVKLVGIDDRGKVKLSMKSVNQETGEDISN